MTAEPCQYLRYSCVGSNPSLADSNKYWLTCWFVYPENGVHITDSIVFWSSRLYAIFKSKESAYQSIELERIPLTAKCVAGFVPKYSAVSIIFERMAFLGIFATPIKAINNNTTVRKKIAEYFIRRLIISHYKKLLPRNDSREAAGCKFTLIYSSKRRFH